MKKPATLLLPILFSIFFTGCELINPPEEVPSYIYIPSYEVKTDSATEGTNSSNLTDVWVTASNRLIGTFELPALIPILGEGNTRLIIQPGVKANGISSVRSIYPFYKEFIDTVDLKRAVVDTLMPVFTYKPDAKFGFIEEFEDTALALELYPNSQTPYTITNSESEAFEGKGALKVILNQEHSIIQLRSTSAYPLPINQAAWLEINYKNSAPINIGLVPEGDIYPPYTVAGANPRDTWNKLYFYLTPAVEAYSGIGPFRVYLDAYLPEGTTEAEVLIDNVKLLYFE